jgi:hypothetical protein
LAGMAVEASAAYTGGGTANDAANDITNDTVNNTE